MQQAHICFCKAGRPTSYRFRGSLFLNSKHAIPLRLHPNHNLSFRQQTLWSLFLHTGKWPKQREKEQVSMFQKFLWKFSHIMLKKKQYCYFKVKLLFERYLPGWVMPTTSRSFSSTGGQLWKAPTVRKEGDTH